MKIPIILISTEGKTKEQLEKEFMTAWKKFLEVKKKIEEEKKKEDFEKETKKLNELSRKNPEPLIRWLEDAEQIPEEGESIDEFIKRTNWTLKGENEWRRIDGLPSLKSKEEYQKLFEEKN